MRNIKQREIIIKEFDNKIIETFDYRLRRAFDFIDETVSQNLIDPKRIRLNPKKLRLSEDSVFYTLQGEGKTMGKPAVFLRLHMCNLQCVWCDAWYTWNPKTKEFWTESFELPPNKVSKNIKSCWPKSNTLYPKRLVITGGEPLLQKKLLDDVIKDLDTWAIEIETNGTITPTKLQLKRAQFNCSPKLDNSKNNKKARIRADVLQVLNLANTQFKFVVMDNEDIDEIEKDFIKPFKLDRQKIVLMPQGVTSHEVHANGQRIVEYTKKRGYQLMGRLHVDLWGARRRV